MPKIDVYAADKVPELPGCIVAKYPGTMSVVLDFGDDSKSIRLAEPHDDANDASPAEWYRDVLEDSDPGLILGNLRIAEDRVLSYGSVLKVTLAFLFSLVLNFFIILLKKRRHLMCQWGLFRRRNFFLRQNWI